MSDYLSVLKFCPRCGGKLEPQEQEGQVMPTCQDKKCGFIFWQSSSPTVAAVILNESEQVLFTRRAIEPGKGKLDLPGGFLQYGELPEDGMKREALEEIGVEIKIEDIIGFVIDDYFYQNVMMRNLVIGMEAVIVSGNSVNSDKKEIDELVWRDFDSIDNSEFALGYNEKLLEMVRQGTRNE
jgi:NADH pyrophosphatase NudC (nudix superfamily)